jgi:phosphoglycerate dehydrogenase-like enzyme
VARRLLLWTGNDDARLAALVGDVEGLTVRIARDRADAIAAMADSDALIALAQSWGADCAAGLEASPIDWIQTLNAGIDTVERWGLPERVTVTTFGGAGAHAVAEHAVQLLLALLRRTPALLAAQQRGEWTMFPTAHAMECLHGKRVAVLGTGHIGRRIAELVRAFGAEAIGVARTARRDASGHEVAPLERLGDVLATCSVVVVALPLNAATDQLLDAAMLARLPRGAYLVNISRGRIVATDALVAGLQSGALAGAGLDVTDPEPLPKSHALWHLPNVIVTPHVAWAGAEAERRSAIDALVVENVRRYLRGEPLLHVAHPGKA